ncbi:MAG: beta-N-acetylhexosaminidase [Clostridia bacterium]|nr:beta-N-acetylhexosaminidase [Clostridia bacterium]
MKRNFDTLSVMLDMSRNAVMNIKSLKEYVDIISKLGYNALFLYTEDTYEVEGEPYFGYMRGRYSANELRDIDSYASKRGVEIIPCIQTLAHLETISRWEKFPMDTPDILLVDDERTYELIDKMFSSLEKCLCSRRIHVGLDEAHSLGRGKHLDSYGYERASDIMRRHLNRVLEIAKKHGYEIMVWSDMFFRFWNGGKFIIPKTTVPEEYKDIIPEEVTPVHWDYDITTEKRLEDMMENLAQMSDKGWYAGSIQTCSGFIPHVKYSVESMTNAINVLKRMNVRNLMVTLWGDNGGECSRYSTIHGLYYIAQYAKGITDYEKIKTGFERTFGIPYDSYMLIDSPNDIAPSVKRSGLPCNPSKYMLFCDPFLGYLDYTVADGSYVFYSEKEKLLADVAQSTRKYGYLFNTASKLCAVLKHKYSLGKRTREAYAAGDREALRQLAEYDYPEAIRALKSFAIAFEKQWMKENKPHGFEVQDIRLGGLQHRLDTCRKRLLAYLDGKLDTIPELEEEILPFHEEGHSAYYHRYHKISTANVL